MNTNVILGWGGCWWWRGGGCVVEDIVNGEIDYEYIYGISTAKLDLFLIEFI